MGSTEERWTQKRLVGVGTFKATERAKELVMQVLESGRISYGSMSQAFEEKFAALHGCKYAVLSNSGTSSLQVALQAMKEVNGWKDGDEVVVPATTFVATANIVVQNRMTPVFVDVDPETYNIDIDQAMTMIGPKTRAVIPVHLFGQPADVFGLQDLIQSSRFRPLIIEDSCEAMFSTHYGQPVGSLGDIGCFSTYVAHLIVTGVGGLSTTNNPEYAAKMRSLVNHGLVMEYLNPDQNFAPQPMVGRRFLFDSYGHSYRITEMEAALGIAQLEERNRMLAVRGRNARHLTAGLQRINRTYGPVLQLPTTALHNTHAWMMYPILLTKDRNGDMVDKVPLMHYLNENGIETRDMLPILCQPTYSYLNPTRYPVSAHILYSGFYVGCHQELEPDDMDYITYIFDKWFGKE